MDQDSTAKLDFFERDADGNWLTGPSLGRPYHIDYERAEILISDEIKVISGGVPLGSLLLAYRDQPNDVKEALLFRVTKAVDEHEDIQRKSNGEPVPNEGANGPGPVALDCRILGTIYDDSDGQTHFGSDVGNLFSPAKYMVVKPNARLLEAMVNFRYGKTSSGPSGVRLGKLRFGSSINYQNSGEDVSVYVNPKDFLGKRTAIFGMTRTGKSNTLKIIIQATMRMSLMAQNSVLGATSALPPFTPEGVPNYRVGQIIFDMNGEYANPNLQDEGTAIIDIYKDYVTSYSVAQKRDFKVMDELRNGRIIIVDLSQGDAEAQTLYSERICKQVFADSMSRFVENKPTNFIQFYFEEAHNLFPRQGATDLTQIYPRIAKEGAKLNLGLVYATQEVSSISANILKNTQNWFISHLNNTDELSEIRKYYDFGDFSDSLLKFSPANDIGFLRMKTYSNPFTIPVQISRFSAHSGE